jgi:plasmid stability protein
MIFHMKTTLIIPDHLIRALKRRAAQSGQTLSAVVAEVVRRGLAEPRSPDLTPLPVHRLGRPRVNIADRDALDRAMEGD